MFCILKIQLKICKFSRNSFQLLIVCEWFSCWNDAKILKNFLLIFSEMEASILCFIETSSEPPGHVSSQLLQRWKLQACTRDNRPWTVCGNYRISGLWPVSVSVSNKDHFQREGSNILSCYWNRGTDVNLGSKPVQCMWHETRWVW